MIPSDLEERKEELQTAEPMAKTAREERDKINSKVANLKNERNTAQKEARQLFERANEIREQLIAEGGLKIQTQSGQRTNYLRNYNPWKINSKQVLELTRLKRNSSMK